MPGSRISPVSDHQTDQSFFEKKHPTDHIWVKSLKQMPSQTEIEDIEQYVTISAVAIWEIDAFDLPCIWPAEFAQPVYPQPLDRYIQRDKIDPGRICGRGRGGGRQLQRATVGDAQVHGCRIVVLPD